MNNILISNYGISAESWVEEMKEGKQCVLFDKPQGVIKEDKCYLKEEDFVLMIMTVAQK